MVAEEFYQNAVGFPPNPLQCKVWEEFAKDSNPALLIRAGTGTGKTEAAILPALQSGRRVILVLPSKALIEDMGLRIVAIAKSLSTHSVSFDVTVDMGGSCRRYQCRNGESSDQTYLRHLFADDVIITTLDKFLFRLFGYGEKIKSYIFPHRVFGSALGKRPFVIFDEAHDYEGLAFSNFLRLLETLYTKGKDLCVMSATLPTQFAGFLKVIDAVDGPLALEQSAFQVEELNMVHRQKKLTLVTTANVSPYGKDEFLEVMEAEVRRRVNPARRMIVRTESVRDLLGLHARLKDLQPEVYHGRLTIAQRRSVIRKLIGSQNDNHGFLVLTTSAIEAGCDLDAHCIVTELCNPDSLVQLAGRLNRRGYMEDAELVVVGDGVPPFASALREGQIESYKRDLAAMAGWFDPEAMQKYFTPPEGDWMGEILFDMLWEYVFDGDLTSKPLWDRGILITRSWEPSVTLCTGINPDSGAPINPVQIGVRRLAASFGKNQEELKGQQVSQRMSVGDDGEWHADLLRAYFTAEGRGERRWSIYTMNGVRINGQAQTQTPISELEGNGRIGARISAYETTLLCLIRPTDVDQYFDSILGYFELPKVLMIGYKSGFQRTLQYRPQMKKDGSFAFENNRVKYLGSLWFVER